MAMDFDKIKKEAVKAAGKAKDAAEKFGRGEFIKGVLL